MRQTAVHVASAVACLPAGRCHSLVRFVFMAATIHVIANEVKQSENAINRNIPSPSLEAIEGNTADKKVGRLLKFLITNPNKINS